MVRYSLFLYIGTAGASAGAPQRCVHRVVPFSRRRRIHVEGARACTGVNRRSSKVLFLAGHTSSGSSTRVAQLLLSRRRVLVLVRVRVLCFFPVSKYVLRNRQRARRVAALAAVDRFEELGHARAR